MIISLVGAESVFRECVHKDQNLFITLQSESCARKCELSGLSQDFAEGVAGTGSLPLSSVVFLLFRYFLAFFPFAILLCSFRFLPFLSVSFFLQFFHVHIVFRFLQILSVSIQKKKKRKTPLRKPLQALLPNPVETD